MIKVNSIFNFNIYLIRKILSLINYMYSIALPIDLAMFLAFFKAKNLSPEALSAKCSISNSVWGNLSTHIFGRNRADLRKRLYLKWKYNSHNIRNKLKEYDLNLSFSNNFQVRIGLDLLSIQSRTSLITETILRDISAIFQGDNLTINLPPNQFDLAKFESDLLHCDNIPIICSSVSSDLEFYDKLKNKYSNSPLDCYNNLGQPLFHSFINYESILWLHGYNFYGSNGPKVIPGFLQFFELIQFEACKGFADSFKFTDNLIEKCTLILVWLASAPELFSDLNNMSVNNLFNKNYVLLSSEKLADFAEWVEKLNIDFEENGIEVLESIYAVYISRLEINAQYLPLEAAGKIDEIENSDSGHIEFPISRANEYSTYDAISFQTFGEFYLDKADWNAISYLDKDDINHIKVGWTNVIADKFSEINSICVLKFKHFWFKKKDSRKLNSPFFKLGPCVSLQTAVQLPFQLIIILPHLVTT